MTSMLEGSRPEPETVVLDEARLRTVREPGLLDHAPEACFDRLTQLAAEWVGAPATFLSRVDATRDFYLSNCGFGEPLATVRQLEGLTFCHHAITSEHPLVITGRGSTFTFVFPAAP